MLRGLLIRKTFLLLDLALIALLLIVAYLVFSTILEPVRAVETPPPPEAVDDLRLAKVGLPADYSVIKENGLFGPAAKTSAPDAASAAGPPGRIGEECPGDRRAQDSQRDDEEGDTGALECAEDGDGRKAGPHGKGRPTAEAELGHDQGG